MKLAYYDNAEPMKALAEKAVLFLQECLAHNLICVTSQLLGEIHHVLTSRGKKVPSADAEDAILEILDSKHVIFRPITQQDFVEALELSARANLHIWDFLLILPFKNELDKIYTMDPHFRDCQLLQVAPVENPFGIWRPEGKQEP